MENVLKIALFMGKIIQQKVKKILILLMNEFSWATDKEFQNVLQLKELGSYMHITFMTQPHPVMCRAQNTVDALSYCM